MTKKFKPLYEFFIEKEEILPETKDNEDGTKTITNVTKKVPYKFCLKTPSRQDRDHSELFYFRQMNEASKAGLMPEAVLIKRLNDNGGLLSENDRRLLTEHGVKIVDKQTELSAAETKEIKDDAEIKKLKEELAVLEGDLKTYSNTYGKLEASTLESSAENWVRNKLIRYYTLNLLYKDVAGQYERYFEGDTLEDRLQKYYELDDLGEELDKFTSDMLSEAFFAAAYFVAAGTVSKELLDKVKEVTAEPEVKKE